MATTSQVTTMINNLLDPVMFQVIGSTPESLVEYIKKGNMKGNTEVCSQLITIAIFACAVNKAAMEQFLAKPEFSASRHSIVAAFNVSGKTNMTALSLLGHCLFESSFITNIRFAREFRTKMGQDSIWTGNFSTGSLSDKQKEILLERARTTKRESAALFASGFLKYCGLDSREWTVSEMNFWGEVKPSSAQQSAPAFRSGTGSQYSPPSGFSAPASVNTHSVLIPGEGNVRVPTVLADYYKKVNQCSDIELGNSIGKRGVQEWIRTYTAIQERDPDAKGKGAGSII